MLAPSLGKTVFTQEKCARCKVCKHGLFTGAPERHSCSTQGWAVLRGGRADLREVVVSKQWKDLQGAGVSPMPFIPILFVYLLV